MPIRNTGALPITEIVTEFGGSTPHGLSEYYGNGSFLSTGYFPNPPPVPSIGSPLNVGAFYGKSKRRFHNITISVNIKELDVVPLFSTFLSESTIPADCILTINAGVTVYGVTGSAMTIAADGSRASKFRSVDTLTIINKGNIVGYPSLGTDGGCGTGVAAARPSAGGSAISILRATTIFNSGIIAGGARGGQGGVGGVVSSSSICSDAVQCTGCQVRFLCTRQEQQNYIRSYSQGCQRGECCDSRTSMRFMNRGGGMAWMNDQCHCGSCKDTPRDPGCFGPCQAQYAQKAMACQTGYNQYAGTCTTSTNTCGGKGGDGATVFSNTVIAGGAPTGAGGATAGGNGGLWGSNAAITGGSLLTSQNIGGTVSGGIV